jgi:SAM-dependent methyltransferase
VLGEKGMASETVHYPPGVFTRLAAAEATHWWFRARNSILLWAFSKYVRGCSTFLEIGCGTGFVLEGLSREFPQLTLSGSEFFEDGLAVATRRVPTADFRKLDATKMDDVERYDCIGAFDVIEHIEDDEAVLLNLHRALRPGGFVMLTVPQHRWLWSIVDEHAQHWRRYSRRELLHKLEKAQFKPIYVSSFVSLLTPLMWLNRRKARDTQDFDIFAEFNIPRLLNVALESAMRFEILLLKMGVRFPIGGSLLVIAKKGEHPSVT